MNKNNKLLLNMVYVALFSAMAFVGTFVHINFGEAIGMLHLGNFVGILAALLFGGIIGGLSGSIGMGLYDILHGYPFDTVIRTLVVKFVAFFIIGTFFKILTKREKKQYLVPIILFVIFLLFGGGLIYTYYTTNIEKLHSILVITGGIIMSVFSIYYLVVFILKNKFNKMMYDVLIATSLGIIVQIVLEFLLRIILQVIIGNGWQESVLVSITKLPTAMVNGTITIILIQVFFMPLYLAVRKIIKK